MRVNVFIGALLTAALIAAMAARNEAQQTPASTVYTANDDGNVSVLDGATLATAHADIETSSGTNAVAVSPDGLRVYAPTTSGDIAVIDATTNELIQSVTVDAQDQVTDVVVSHDSSKVYATLRQAGTVVVINTTTLQKIDTFNLESVSTNSPQPEEIDLSTDGNAVFVLTPPDFAFQKISTVDGSFLGSAPVMAGAQELRVSADGSTVIVVGPSAAQFFSASTLAPVQGASTTDLGEQVDVAVAGTNVYVLNERPNQPPPEPPPPEKKPGPKGEDVPNQPTVDVYVAATGAYVKSFPLEVNSLVIGIAVLSDGSRAFVSKYPGVVTALDLTSGALGPAGNTGSYPNRLTVLEAGPETPVVSYFLPRNINMKLKGAGKDSLIAAGFYDDGGPRPDYTLPVTIDVGSFFTKTFTLVPKGKSFASPKDPVVKFFILPNLKGSSRGRFKMQLSKATLTGANPDLPVEFHFHATGLPDCQGKVTLTAGRYKFGKKRGALFLPQFFPQRASAKVGAANADSLAFVGGFATNGQTPNSLTGLVRFGFGPAYARAIQGTLFKKAGDKFKYSEKVGKTVVFTMTLDFLRETVSVAAKKAELGNLDTATTNIRFDAGTGAGTFRNTVRIATKGSKRFY